MTWQILIAISVLLYSTSTLLQRVLLKHEKSEPVSFSIFFQFCVVAVSAVLVLIIRGKIPLPDFSHISWSVLVMTLLYGIASIAVFKSLKEIEASRFTVIMSGKTLFALAGAYIFFKDYLTFSQLTGALLILAGVIIVTFRKMNSKIGKGDLWAILGAAAFGLANTNDRFLVKFFDPYSYVVIGFLLPGILIALINPGKIKYIKTYLKKQMFSKILIMCTIYALSAIAFFSALQISPNSSQVFAINAFTGVLTVAMAIVILKEKDYLGRKIIGVILSLAGLLLVNK